MIIMRSYCIPVLAPDPVTAHAWLNETLAPTTVRDDVIVSGRASPVSEANYLLPTEILINPAIYPPAIGQGSAPVLDRDSGAGGGPSRRLGRGQAVISALFTVLLVLLAGLVNSRPPSRTPADRRRLHTPSKPPASSTIKVMVAALPKDASRVKIVTDEATYPPGTAECGSSPRKLCRPRSSPDRGSLTCGSPSVERRTRLSARSSWSPKLDRLSLLPIGQSRRRKPSRKVGTPKGRVPGNSRTGKPDGKRNRKQTANPATCRRRQG